MICPYNVSLKAVCKVSKHTKNHGFSLIELLVVLVLISTISGIAAPNFWNLFTKTMEQQDLFEFTEKLTVIRLEAWKAGRGIRLNKNGGSPWPQLPEGWKIQRLPELRFLSTGITNGGHIIVSSNANNHWQIAIEALDGHVTLIPLSKLPKLNE